MVNTKFVSRLPGKKIATKKGESKRIESKLFKEFNITLKS
uniref:Uncharacterized protein n=1 Tax=Tetranychus urticae TaxID=32264 RepID=T1L314_TETUR